MHANKQPNIEATVYYNKFTAPSLLHISTCTCSWSNTVPNSTNNMLRMASTQWQRMQSYSTLAHLRLVPGRWDAHPFGLETLMGLRTT